MKTGLSGLVPNAWEPILEKYRGHGIVIERKVGAEVIKESGILEDYSSKYLLVREVEVKDQALVTFLKKFKISENAKHDLIYNRSVTIIRHTIAS